MPCRDYSSDYDLSVERQRKVDKLTRMLCTVLSAYNEAGIRKLPAEVREWWREHQALDRQRLAAEEASRQRARLKKRALDKLTPEERKALGVR